MKRRQFIKTAAAAVVAALTGIGLVKAKPKCIPVGRMSDGLVWDESKQSYALPAPMVNLRPAWTKADEQEWIQTTVNTTSSKLYPDFPYGPSPGVLPDGESWDDFFKS